MKKSFALTVIVLAAFASVAFAQQASIKLENCSSGICNTKETTWTLEKCDLDSGGNCVPNFTPVSAPTKVNWRVEVKEGVTTSLLTVSGFVSVTNSGSAPATIGNVVVNLQKPGSGGKTTNWVSASADVADATSGDAATTASICSGASTEGKSSFTENAASGKLTFTDPDGNPIFEQSPIPPVSGTTTYKYEATFNNAILDIQNPGEVRVEVIVTFGNSGGRGNGGASCNNVDIDGSGGPSGDEANVRSVPCRVTVTVPVQEVVNASVTLTDTDPPATKNGAADIVPPTFNDLLYGIWTFGAVSYSNFTTDVGGGSGTEQFTASGTTSATRNVSVDITATGQGAIANCASLQGSGVGSDCLTPLDTKACAWPTVCPAGTIYNPVTGICQTAVPYCTFTQGGWGSDPHGKNPGALLADNFAAVYPGGSVEIGIPGTRSMRFTSATAVQNYLPQGGTPSALTGATPLVLDNPTTSSAEVFGGQVLALQLSVDFSNAGVKLGGLASVVYTGSVCSALSGSTVAQILAAANIALGGGVSPCAGGISELNDLVTMANEAFDNCVALDPHFR